MERAYQEVIEGIAGGTTPQNVVAFRPSSSNPGISPCNSQGYTATA